jgi:hypothetical protein
MKINIEITIDGEKISTESFTDRYDILKSFQEKVDIAIYEYLDKMTISQLEELINVKKQTSETKEHETPFDEEIPPPENSDSDIPLMSIGKQGIYEEILREEHPNGEEKPSLSDIPKGEYKTVSPRLTGKRGRPYKQVTTPTMKYLNESTIAAIRNGKELNLPGVQAQKNKFVVAGTYMKGNLEDARKLYKKYFISMNDDYYDILTWGSWLISYYIPSLKDTK